jgi:hypothetical protein
LVAKLRKTFETTKKVEKKCCATFATFSVCYKEFLGVSLIVIPLHKGCGKSGFLGIISVSVATVGF